MAPSEQRDTKPNPATQDDLQEAELFAASAAEGALTDRKDRSSAEEIDQLTIAAEQVTLENDKKPQSSDASSTESPHSKEGPTDVKEEPDRVLTKEELVEEALACPCIASMRDGPCGDSFISAYRCFLESETEPKGMNCMDQFKSMQGCMAEHPEEYNLDDDDDEEADPFAAQKNSTNAYQSSAHPSSSGTQDPDSVLPSTSTSS